MIDIEKAEYVLKKYVSEYDLKNEYISLKYYHSFRVATLCKEIALSLKLNNEEVLLAELIGLLHDIARFEQATKYKSFNDLKTLDHGELGVNILFEENKIRDFIDIDKYDELIKKAVFVHNKATVPDYYKEEERLYANIVRDADKLDILYLSSIKEIKYDMEESISGEVLERIMSKSFINYEIVKTGFDKLLLNLAFIYDLNFPYSYEVLRKKNYINVIIDSLKITNSDTKKTMNNIKNLLNEEICKNKGDN